MNHCKKKIAKIVEELTMYFFTFGADKIESKITVENEQVIIEFQSNYLQEFRQKLHSLDKYLNQPKNEGIEEFYWELAGSGDPGETNQLILLGMMIDRADISITDEYANLRLYRAVDDEC